MKKVETETGKMVAALRDGLHGLHLSRMALVAEAKALRLAGRKAERDRVWARVEEITAQIEVTNRELAEHMLRWENETRTANSRPTTKRRQPVTQRDAAKLCGVTEKTIRRWEKGEATPERYPGRHDAVTLRSWAAWREQTRKAFIEPDTKKGELK